MSDTARGPYPRLSAAAVERAKTKLGITELDSLGTALGFSRPGFWRARQGLLDIRYSHALRIANRIGWPVSRVFEDGDDA